MLADDRKPPRRRFSWPMRIFLTLILFDMVFHSLAHLFDYQTWLDSSDPKVRSLAMTLYPKGLPSWPEIAELSAKDAVQDRVFETLDSAWDYARPWPGNKTRDKIESWDDGGKYVLAWLGTRLAFAERLLGLSQQWMMFSPSVDSRRNLARTRLLFADDTCATIRLSSDPADLTHYLHLGDYRVMCYEGEVHRDFETRVGYCQMLSHRYPKNDKGAPLQSIFVYRISYDYPPPGVAADSFLKGQTGPPNWDKNGPFFEYDVAKGKAYTLSKEQQQSVQKRLATLPDAKPMEARSASEAKRP